MRIAAAAFGPSVGLDVNDDPATGRPWPPQETA